MYPQTLAPQTSHVLEKIVQQEFIADFYLAGGTALALQLGHRESIDLDFFSVSDFSLERLKYLLPTIGRYELTREEEGTLDGLFDDVKMTFLRYEYPLLFPIVEFQGIRLADERDIACMKIDAISSRGSKKDFIDLYFLLEKYSIAEILDFFGKKYSHIRYNKLHILKSLAYFVDAEEDPMPKMLQAVEWDAIKQKLVDETKKLV